MPLCPRFHETLWGNTLKVALLTSDWTPDYTAEYWADVSSYEVSGTGYTAGGATLASKTRSYDAASGRVTFDCADVVWASSTITAKHAVVVDTDATDDPIVGIFTFPEEQTSVNGNFTLQISVSGLFTQRFVEFEG